MDDQLTTGAKRPPRLTKAIRPKKHIWGTRCGRTAGGNPKTGQCRVQFVCPAAFRDMIESSKALVGASSMSDAIRRLIDLGRGAAEAAARGGA